VPFNRSRRARAGPNPKSKSSVLCLPSSVLLSSEIQALCSWPSAPCVFPLNPQSQIPNQNPLSSVLCPMPHAPCALLLALCAMHFRHLLLQIPAYPKPQIDALAVAVIPVRRPQDTDAGLPPAGAPDDVMHALCRSHGVLIFLLGVIGIN